MVGATPACASCKKTAAEANIEALKQCAKCRTTQYCSRDCQKDDWKIHKKICGKNAAARNDPLSNAEHSSTYTSARLNDLEKHIPNPFTKLDQGKYLHDRPEKDVYKLLIDSYRMRQADDLNLENKKSPPFPQYLAKAGTRSNLLPPWWDAEKQKECEAFGKSGAWQDLRRGLSKQELIDHYGDEKMPMQVRMLADAVYGAGSRGADGTMLRKHMASMESGGYDGYTSHVRVA